MPYVGDYASLATSVVRFGVHPSWDSAADVGLDAVGAALPLVPALGTAHHAEKLEEVADAMSHGRKLRSRDGPGIAG